MRHRGAVAGEKCQEFETGLGDIPVRRHAKPQVIEDEPTISIKVVIVA